LVFFPAPAPQMIVTRWRSTSMPMFFTSCGVATFNHAYEHLHPRVSRVRHSFAGTS
jgi:hypothetical protein